MTEKEVLDKVLFGYDVKVPDVLSHLDFTKVEMEEVKPVSIKKKYLTAAVIYAAACVAVIIALPFIIGGNVDPDKPVPAVSGEETTATEENREAVHDFGGAEFKFLHMGKNKQRKTGNERLVKSYARDVYLNPCDWSSEIMNEAVAERNSIVEEDCNVKFVFEAVEDTIGEARKRMRAGQCDFNAILAEGNATADLVTDSETYRGGYLADYHSVENIELTKSYWLPDAVDSLSAADKMFFYGGLITMDPIAHSDILYFNRDLMDELGIEYPYGLVESGEWTYDKFLDMLQASEEDLDGDGEITNMDQWCGVQANYLRQIIIESEPSTRRLDDGSYEYMSSTEKSYAAYEKYIGVIDSLYTGREHGFGNVWNDYEATSAFKDGRTLFMMGCVDYARNLYNVDFGIVPIPVLSTGDEYVTHGSGNSNMISIPRDNPDMEMTGTVLDYMAKVSEEIILPAYIEENIGPDTEENKQNLKMFGIIKNSIRYDWTEMYMWGSAYDHYIYNSTRESRFARWNDIKATEMINNVLEWFEK